MKTEPITFISIAALVMLCTLPVLWPFITNQEFPIESVVGFQNKYGSSAAILSIISLFVYLIKPLRSEYSLYMCAGALAYIFATNIWYDNRAMIFAIAAGALIRCVARAPNKSLKDAP